MDIRLDVAEFPDSFAPSFAVRAASGLDFSAVVVALFAAQRVTLRSLPENGSRRRLSTQGV